MKLRDTKGSDESTGCVNAVPPYGTNAKRIPPFSIRTTSRPGADLYDAGQKEDAPHVPVTPPDDAAKVHGGLFFGTGLYRASSINCHFDRSFIHFPSFPCMRESS
ncbi:hypothetical protein LJC41_05870 [Desulfosarcina sp. OttesenSCG-928-G17]|nr:hypothetical protein [Desulfosarcina sp. OttesenSCG-928-G17]